MKKIMSFILLTCLISASSWAGDLATYINLGFSENSRYFMFGQYGIEGSDSLPYAEVFTVDVDANTYTPGGVRKGDYDTPPQAGQNGLGALLNLLRNIGESSSDTIGTYKIDHLQSGRLVYILINGQTPKSEIEFRDFSSGNHYKVQLNQTSFEDKGRYSAAFHINLTVTDKDGNISAHTIGLPGYKRQDVKRYRIKQVVFSPDESSLVFIVEKEEETDEGINIRYMAETVNLD
ncbi:MAG: DUF2259 domain-containing protein [Spirochaetales bacterium]|nr:DUF2259 domain-containing protein [Spirochaetales bacterium]